MSNKEVGSKDFYIKYIKKCVNSTDYGGERLIHREGEEGWPGEAGQRSRESGRRQARHEGILSHGAIMAQNLETSQELQSCLSRKMSPLFCNPRHRAGWT